MALSTTKPVPRTENESLATVITLAIAAAFLLLGLGAILLIVQYISEIANTRAVDEVGGTTLLRFLDAYGVIIPFILGAVGIALIGLAIRLFQRDTRAASWARQILLWMVVASAVMVIQSGNAALGSGESWGAALAWAIPWLVIGAVAGFAWWWIGANPGAFVGTETLSQTSARSAWNLLIPTLIVLVVVALRPLEKTLVASLTDDRFASNDVTNFVGLENYARLLAMRFDSIGCVRGDDGACTVEEDGALVFPRPRDVLDEGYQESRFRDVATIPLGENRLLFSVRDDQFWESIGNTLTFSFFSVIFELTIGLFIALVINSKFPGRGLLRTAMLVPWAIPTVVSARLWEVMLRDNRSGVINSAMLNLGLIDRSQAWLATAQLQIPTLVAIDVWKTTPFMALILLAGLQVISGDLYEAADVDGASKIRQFFSITLPLLRPAIAVALVFRTLDAVRVFDLFQVLTPARRSMATYNFFTLVQEQELGYASAIGVLIFIIILIFTATYVRILGVNAE